MIILGAGMAGLLAGHIFRSFAPTIWEAQPTLPNNHDALLRFRSDRVSKSTGIPFKKVKVHKTIFHNGAYHDPDLSLCNQYSRKVTGKVLERSIWNLDPVERYIAPPDFISRMARGLNILYGVKADFELLKPKFLDKTPIISTIPMPAMMKIMEFAYPPKFNYLPIWSLVATIQVPVTDIYQTIYYPDILNPVYRASITGNILTIEALDEFKKPADTLNDVVEQFGIIGSIVSDVRLHRQEYGKIAPINDDDRKDFIYALTRDFGIYSLGRFATWRQILLDDVVQDCEVINKLVSAEGKRRLYHQRIEAAN